MRNTYETYYALFNDRDAERAAQFDAIMDDPKFADELKAKMTEWYNVAKESVRGLGEKGAKVVVMSIVEVATMRPDELSQAMDIGRMVHAAAPNQ